MPWGAHQIALNLVGEHNPAPRRRRTYLFQLQLYSTVRCTKYNLNFKLPSTARQMSPGWRKMFVMGAVSKKISDDG